MKHIRFGYIIIYMASLLIAYPPVPSYASNRNIGRIRGYASKQNDRIYNKIAISLVNGRANNISIDSMSRLLKNYNIIQFDQTVNTQMRDMIINEVAYRMIRNYYLPTVYDKIRVYRKSAGLLRQAIPYARLVLPVDYARTGSDKKIDTLRWPEMSSQVSLAIESLWMNRIRSSSDDTARQQESMDIIDVLGRLKAISDSEIAYSFQEESSAAEGNVLSEATDFIFTSWQIRGIVFESDIPALAGLLRQYILLNSFDSLRGLATDIKGLADITALHNALIQSVYIISQSIKSNNPSDFATLAMLQAMLSDISDKISSILLKIDAGHTNLKARG